MLDGSGHMLITNDGSVEGQPDAVLTFNVGDNGDLAPLANISGSSTMLNLPSGIAMDTQGHVVVANLNSDSIVVFPAGASGNQSPSEVIQGSATHLANPAGLAVATAPGPP
jgi:6-phosphogluconolactonase (cycloisomerase 2 family)